MKKVVTILAAALFLGACHCTCTKNTGKTTKKPVQTQAAAKPAPKKEPAKPAKTVVDDKDFTEVAKVNRKADRVVLTYKEPINFRYNSDEIDPASLKPIKQTARALKKYPDHTVRVAGYTDSFGPADYNMDLSQRRAKAVALELVKEGVPAKNVSFIGYGEANPIASNKTREGRAKNRRVELEIK